MYNEKQKLDFISSYTTSVKTANLLKQIFNRTEFYENKYGNDLSQATAEQIQEYFDNQSKGIRSATNELTLKMITNYVTWCSEKGLPISDGVYNVKLSTIEIAKQVMVSSPLHLKERLDEYFDSPDDNTIDITYRVFLWMAFAGLKDVDAIRVEAKNVDLDNLLIHFEGHDYELYKEAKEDFNKACNLLSFTYTHAGKLYYKQSRSRADGDNIMRGFRTSQPELLTLRPVINKALSQTKLERESKQNIDKNKARISYHKLRLSGVFYRQRKLEIDGYKVDFSALVAQEMQEKQYSFSRTRTPCVVANFLAKNYMNDYITWKCAFPL